MDKKNGIYLKTCLRVILGEMYISYESALEMCNLQSLHERRETRSLNFALKCVQHPTNSRLFPRNQSADTHSLRRREKFHVNLARKDTYKSSAIPVLQHRLNAHCANISVPAGQGGLVGGKGGRICGEGGGRS